MRIPGLLLFFLVPSCSHTWCFDVVSWALVACLNAHWPYTQPRFPDQPVVTQQPIWDFLFPSSQLAAESFISSLFLERWYQKMQPKQIKTSSFNIFCLRLQRLPSLNPSSKHIAVLSHSRSWCCIFLFMSSVIFMHSRSSSKFHSELSHGFTDLSTERSFLELSLG